VSHTDPRDPVRSCRGNPLCRWQSKHQTRKVSIRLFDQ